MISENLLSNRELELIGQMIAREYDHAKACKDMIERIADGQEQITDDGRCKLSQQALQQIWSSNEPSHALAAQYGVAASTIRAARERMRA